MAHRRAYVESRNNAQGCNEARIPALYGRLQYRSDIAFLAVLSLAYSPTATLPHEKYYNMSIFEQQMSLVRNGETITVPDEGYDFRADVSAHSRAHKGGPSSSNETTKMRLRRPIWFAARPTPSLSRMILNMSSESRFSPSSNSRTGEARDLRKIGRAHV